MESQRDEALNRLERMLDNADSGMTRERYLEMCEQMGNEPLDEEIPPNYEDMPEVIIVALTTFSLLGDRVYPDIGYIGKDYTNLDHYIDVFGIDDKEYFMSILSWLDSRMIKKSSEEMKKQHDKLKRQSSGSKRDQTPYQGRR